MECPQDCSHWLRTHRYGVGMAGTVGVVWVCLCAGQVGMGRVEAQRVVWQGVAAAAW